MLKLLVPRITICMENWFNNCINKCHNIEVGQQLQTICLLLRNLLQLKVKKPLSMQYTIA